MSTLRAGSFFLLFSPASLLAQNTLFTSGGNAAPGTVVNIPVTISLNAGVTVDTLAFGVQVIANSPAPALTGSLTFTKDASLPAPGIIDNAQAPNRIAVAWLLPALNPPLTGTQALGFITMTIPATAQDGQSYTVEVSGVSALSGSNPVELTPGPNATLSVPATYLVGDVFPLGQDLNGDGDRDDAGEFGDGMLNNLDLIQALRAVVNLSRPPGCSDRFDAMDAFPVDAMTRGGDGTLDNLDLIRTLRRVVSLDTSRPVRASRGSCTAPARSPEGMPVSGRGSREAEASGEAAMLS